MNASATLGAANVRRFPTRAFLLTFVVVSLWVNASEVLRYFAFVMPMTRDALSMVPDVAPMNLPVFASWACWDSLLVALTVLLYWLYAERFGASLRSVVAAGTLGWLFVFVLFWVATKNIGLARFDVIAIALPWAWLETVVSCAIARQCFRRFALES